MVSVAHETEIAPHAVPGGLASALLGEIVEALGKLVDRGQTTVIDLKSLPMLPGDRDALAEFLGEGEVSADLKVAGVSEVRETAYAGVWWVRHLGGNGEVASELIEIAAVPEILRAHHDDISIAAARLTAEINTPTPEWLDKDTSHV